MSQIAEQLRYALRPIQHLLDDPDFTDIHVNGPNNVYTKSRGRRVRHDVEISEGEIMAIAKHAAVLNNNRVTDVMPIAPGLLPDGQRIHIVIPTAVPDGMVALAIRRASDVPFSVAELKRRGVFQQTKSGKVRSDRSGVRECYEIYKSGDYCLMLERAFYHGLNVAFGGKMNTGKTTNLLAFTFEIPIERRVGTIEDTYELHKMPHGNAVHFRYPADALGRAQHTSEMCSEACLRMDFDEIIYGEVRTGAAWGLARVGISGHSWKCSLHAESAEDVPNALAAMAKQHDTGKTLSVDYLQRTFRNMTDIAVYSEVIDGEKRITDIWFEPFINDDIPREVQVKAEEPENV